MPLAEGHEGEREDQHQIDDGRKNRPSRVLSQLFSFCHGYRWSSARSARRDDSKASSRPATISACDGPAPPFFSLRPSLTGRPATRPACRRSASDWWYPGPTPAARTGSGPGRPRDAGCPPSGSGVGRGHPARRLRDAHRVAQGRALRVRVDEPRSPVRRGGRRAAPGHPCYPRDQDGRQHGAEQDPRPEEAGAGSGRRRRGGALRRRHAGGGRRCRGGGSRPTGHGAVAAVALRLGRLLAALLIAPLTVLPAPAQPAAPAARQMATRIATGRERLFAERRMSILPRRARRLWTRHP